MVHYHFPEYQVHIYDIHHDIDLYQQQLPPLPPGMSIEQYKMLIAQERMKQEGIMREKQKQMMLQNLMAQHVQFVQ